MASVGKDIPTIPRRPRHRRIDLHRRHAAGAQRAARRFRRLAGRAWTAHVARCFRSAQSAGRRRVFTAKDIPGHNMFGPVVKDEHLLVERRAPCSSAIRSC